ncbi:MAG: response regulator transcription factor [Bacteroidota bacterium]
MKRKLTILIVDDNINFIKRMISMLDDLDNINYINVANNFDEANRSFMAERPDLVLLDINMPGKSGIDLLRQIKSSEWKCQVIMITNHADSYYKELCTDLGASYFLDKSSEFGMVPLIIEGFNQN